MKTADKQKMCTNCHGRIPIEAESCLYCGQEQTSPPAEETSAHATLFEQKSLQDSLTSLYSPPSSSKRPSFLSEKEESQLLKPGKTETDPVRIREAKRENQTLPEEEEGVQENRSLLKGSLSALLLLLLGGNLFALGLMQFFFSDGKALRLEWQADNWYLYCLVAAPLLFVGYRLAGKLK